MLEDTIKMLKEITKAQGIPGNEKEPREIMKKYAAGYVDTFETDNLGSLIAKKTGNSVGPKIMLAAHLDEVGFIITRIDEQGFIFFQTLGGWWSHVLLGQTVVITTRKGRKIKGIVGTTPHHAHDKKNVVELQDLYIDIGVANKKEVVDVGIRLGDMVSPHFELATMVNEDYIMAKSWDDRVGCAVIIEVLRHLKYEEHHNTVYAVGTIQEEVGNRGAKTSAHKIKPDMAFVIDVANAKDTPGASKNKTRELGKGPLVVYYDKTMIAHKGLINFVIDIAEKYDIPYQMDAFNGGGTDGGSIHLSEDGIPTITLGIAVRYVHSTAGIIHKQDFEWLVSLLVALIKESNADILKKIYND
jgi:putative aminopeptidase FrvX